MKLTLNVGSGDRVFNEYPDGYRCINVDIRNLSKTNVISDVKSLPFKNEMFDYVLASDIVEHFPILETDSLLKEWRRVLVKDGVLEVRTPNLKWAVLHYVHNRDAKFVSYHIFGGQDYFGNFHYVIFDRFWLRDIMLRNGFMEINYEEDGSNFIMKVRKI